MAITVKNAEVIIRLTEKRLAAIEQEFERALSDEATRIVLRTRRGKDVGGQDFAPYSEQYARYRKAKGRKDSPVDLTFTGNMLNAVQTEVRKEPGRLVGRIFFNSAREALKAAGNMVKRRFFGFSDEQKRRLIERLKGAK